jgi:hypothetical protein
MEKCSRRVGGSNPSSDTKIKIKMELTEEQKTNAKNWLSQHKDHVSKLIEEEHIEYAPSLEDASHPELWKPAHWRWFIMNNL